MTYENDKDVKKPKLTKSVGSASVPESTSPILMLNDYCLHQIFDWLLLKDLIAIGNTCKQLQRIAGNFFQLNYAAMSARGDNDGIYISALPSNIFNHYIQKISISGDRLGAYRYIAANCKDSIKQLRVYGCLPVGAFEYIKGILNGIERLEMTECMIEGEFYENHLKYCTNLKSLSVSRSAKVRNRGTVIGCGNDWLLQKYPTLEHFELTELAELHGNELQQFFNLNPNIRTFSTDVHGLWVNRHSIRASNVRLDTLAVNVCQSTIVDANNQIISIKDSIYDLLDELHRHGFYQHLHLYIYILNKKEDLRKLLSLNSIEMLNGDIVHMDDAMDSIKILGIAYPEEIANIENLPKNLMNLERLFFARICSVNVLPFICYSATLQVIKIRKFLDRIDSQTFNLEALNKKREQLVGARKIRIYVNEDFYLALKMTQKSVNFSLIELKRYESIEWAEFCAKARYYKMF